MRGTGSAGRDERTVENYVAENKRPAVDDGEKHSAPFRMGDAFYPIKNLFAIASPPFLPLFSPERGRRRRQMGSERSTDIYFVLSKDFFSPSSQG